MLIRFFLCILVPLFGFSIDRTAVLADFDLTDIPVSWESISSETCQVTPISFGQVRDYAKSGFGPTVKRVILMNPYVAREEELSLIPREKLVLFSWEPMPIVPSFYEKVSRVYTYNDALVDNQHFFKLFYPFRKNMIDNRPSFSEKKFCTMVTRHWTDDRADFVRFFHQKPEGDFEFYGSDPGDFADNMMYRGRIPGYHSGDEKVAVLKHYRFCICFENSYHLRGYITEKIFSCFAAGCIPVYLGAPNICEYIPKNCFIDYRDFPTHEALYQFMKSMPEHVYEQYVRNIRSYLESSQSYVFSPEHFVETLYHAIGQ